MTRRALALACALLTATVGVARAADRARRSRKPARQDSTPSSIGRSSPARARASARGARSRVIIRTVDGRPASPLIEAVNGVAGRYFPWLGGQVAIVPDAALDRLASRPEVAAISLDRAVRGTMDRTTSATGSRWVTEHLGVTGAGVGVATIDSGVNPWHEDLGRAGRALRRLRQRAAVRPTTTTDTARTSRASSPAAASARTARSAAWPPARTSSC